MLRPLLRSGALLLALTVLGCGSPPEVVDDGEDKTRLAEQIDVSVADWLGKPREELANLVKERLGTVRMEQDDALANPDKVDLLPNLKPFVSLPVFQESAYSKPAGVSLPPYLRPGVRDREV